MDAFLNFETVKLFGNGLLEVRQYDTSLTAYQASLPFRPFRVWCFRPLLLTVPHFVSRSIHALAVLQSELGRIACVQAAPARCAGRQQSRLHALRVSALRTLAMAPPVTCVIQPCRTRGSARRCAAAARCRALSSAADELASPVALLPSGVLQSLRLDHTQKG